MRGVVNQMLSELDGASTDNEGLFVLAASNHPWDIDSALLRPGRFDRTVLVLPPDVEARESILSFHLRGRPTGSLDLRKLAKGTDGFSGADLALVCEQATEQAMESSMSSGQLQPITQQQLVEAARSVPPQHRRVDGDGPQLRAVRQRQRGLRRPGRLPQTSSPLAPTATRSRCIPTSQGNARDGHTLRSWTRYATRTPPAPASDRPSSLVVTSSCTPSTSCSSGSRAAARSGRSSSPDCAAWERPCCSTPLRSAAVRAHWGTGKLEARPDQRLRRPLSAALHVAVRELGHPAGDQVDHVLGVIKAFAQRDAEPGAKLREKWNPGIDAPAAVGRADSGDIEIDLVELLTDVGGLAADVGRGVAIFIDEMQDLAADDVSAICAACHEIAQSGLPVIVVGAGLPHLPAVLSASKSYSERLFRYQRIDRLDRAAADLALVAPAGDEDADFEPAALEALYAATAGYPYFVQAYGKVAWDVAPRSPITAQDVAVSAPEAEAELAVGFFGSRFERATPAEREYLRAMADAARRSSTGARRSTRPSRSPPRPSRRCSTANPNPFPLQGMRS